MSLSATTAPPRASSTAFARRPAAHAPGRLLNRLDVKYSPYLYIAPFFVIFGVFGAVPDGAYRCGCRCTTGT